ncbi:hypothetical protein GOP47_0012013 [Adiantum capillus-veneris]|uniref:Uncharacterized protein n=1 Tax=Adiantum capillus-veneris TaxID=13818 RepID=A0A9D4UUJ4_ADICA|nr:hypothetical protein GOP47_0012013 [Adiantum capillus-veneris]
MFICKSESCLDFLDDNWDRKKSQNKICILQKKSIICKFIISSQNFLVSFYYIRYHLLSGQLIPLDQDTENSLENKPLSMELYFRDSLLSVMETMSSTNLAQLKIDLTCEELPFLPKFYAFSLNNRKILRCKEKTTLCKESITNTLHLIASTES